MMIHFRNKILPVCQEGLEFNEDLGFCVPTECPEGQELNEETGICVLEEQPIVQQEQAAEEEQQMHTEHGTFPRSKLFNNTNLALFCRVQKRH